MSLKKKMMGNLPMDKNKPYIIHSNEQACYVTPEVMKQFDDELDESSWAHLLDHIEKLQQPKKRNHE